MRADVLITRSFRRLGLVLKTPKKRPGDVVLEVVVQTDGSVASTRPVSGDPVLAAAASDAVRTWRYDPYRVQGHPAEFQTDVTLKFSLPE